MSTAIHAYPINAVLFDLDGTLLDTAPDLALAVNQLRQRHQRPELDYERIRATVSHGARALVTLAFGVREGEHNFENLRLELLELYSQQLAVNTALFAGIDGLLNTLEQRDIAWGVVTNKPRPLTVPILRALDLERRCQSLVCPEDVTRAKPDPEPLLLACTELGCEPAQAVYIGDHQRDIEAGRRAGMTTIASAYGYLESNDDPLLWQADFCVQHAKEILPLLQPRLASKPARRC